MILRKDEVGRAFVALDLLGSRAGNPSLVKKR